MSNRLAPPRTSAVVIIAFLLSACGSTGVESPSMAPSTGPVSASPAAPTSTSPGTVSPVPNLQASPTPTAGGAVSAGWPYTTTWDVSDVLFAPDGRVVVVEAVGQPEQSRVVAFATDGTVLRGWPWTPAATGGQSIVRAALGPDGSVYAAVRVGTGVPVTYTWTLHRLSSAGNDFPGFPVGLPNGSYCGLKVAGDGAAIVACQVDDGATGTTTTVVTAIRPDGSAVAGWPLTLAGAGEVIGFRPDGALVVGMPGDPTSSITVIGRDGRVPTGWPRNVTRYDAATVDGGGRVWITAHTWAEGECASASQTSYTVLGLDGQTAGGWPVAVAGWASEPVLVAGSMYAATGSDQLVAYSASGQVLPGWPAQRVSVTMACQDGSQPVSAGDAGVVVVGDARATLVSPNGRVATGWPVTMPYEVAPSCLYCTPGPARPIDPVVGQRAVYVATYDHGNPRIVAIDRKGSMPEAWQRSLGTGSGELRWMGIAPTGRVWAGVSEGSTETSTTIYLIAEDSVVGG